MDSENIEYMDFDKVTIDLDNGGQMDCDIDCIFPVGEKIYVALLPLDANGEADENADVMLYGFEKTDDGQAVIFSIDDEEELVTVKSAYNQYVDFFADVQ